MLSDLFCFILALLGVVFLLYYILYKILLWGERGWVLVIPAYGDNKLLCGGLRNTIKLLDFTGLGKHCVIIVLDCGEHAEELERVRREYAKEERLFIASKGELGELAELLGKRFR